MELFSEPDAFFTPEKSLPPQSDPPLSSLESSSSKPCGFVVELPVLTLTQKSAYKMASNTSLKSGNQLKVDEVIGEYSVGGILYYFARYEGGIAHKYPSQSFIQDFGGLVDQFKRKKIEGSLPPFDPSANYVHPLSRITMTLNISKRYGATASVSSARSRSSVDVEVVSDSQEEDDDDSADDDDDNDREYDETDMLAAPRRSERSKSKHVLPFSPKKTRSRRILIIDSDQEHSDIDDSDRRPIRRSTRSKKGVKVNLDAETYSDDQESEGETSDDYDSRKLSRLQSKKRKKAVRPKAARPTYGHFRNVADLDYDYSDDENMPIGEHRDICEKCHRGPAHNLIEALAKKSKGKGKKKRKTPDDEFEDSNDEEERFTALGGWVRCLKCPVVAHWRCLANTQRDEILKAARDIDRKEWERSQITAEAEGIEATGEAPGKRSGLNINQTTEFICGGCMKGGVCMGCMEIAIEPDAVNFKRAEDNVSSENQTGDVTMSDRVRDTSTKPNPVDESRTIAPQSDGVLLFRCFTCKRIAHYEHLPKPPTLPSDGDLTAIVEYYAQTWLCADCLSYRDGVDKIIAWRAYPPNAVEPPRSPDELPNYKSPLPREYLVKWLDRSYRRLQWVPHMWLLSTHQAKLKNFLTGGSKVELLQAIEDRDDDAVSAPVFEIGDDSRASSAKPGTSTPFSPLEANPDAERRIPAAWKTIDRVLDVHLWHPTEEHTKRKAGTRRGKKKGRVVSDNDTEEDDESIESKRVLAFECGEQPDVELMESISDWEERTGETFTLENISLVVWAFIKWTDLGYDEATWDSPPRPGEVGYKSFQNAMERFILSRTVVVRKDWSKKFDKRAKEGSRKYLLKDASQLKLGQRPDLKLMPFQVDGFNWLFHNWWIHQHCILADEMGLGKTVQIATFLGHIVDKMGIFPALVVVPNSTITNWVREFERWAPNVRVVPFYGEAKARDVIKSFELTHDTKRRDETGAKYHVLITTYESLINPKDFTPVFKNQPRWEVVVIDEGQRLKSDTSLLFKKLNELNSVHRIIMTGTPLNNNIRELFNLMNFLDPDEWNDLEALEKEHEELTEDLVKQLHNRLRPYFLRRLKSEVLQLPPKNEVIVPLSMAPLQKQVYRSILSHNVDLINGLTQPSGSKVNGTVIKGGINNVLMQLRKCLQHPYLYAEDIEPRGLPDQEAHEKLIDGSTKLRLLKSLLPKLKARGHRVLLFSQFVIALNIIEDFLSGEGLKYLRLDGHTKGSERQKGMDEFNKPGSDVFVYLLTTRAGGVGINLFSADTVIIFDPDFNPHQDLQAIARAYRYGQQKTCLVFKLMVKDSAEERIVQVGKKKLVLDHLIVQKMDDEESGGENIQSILTFGAQALFDADNSSRDIIYTDNDIDKLIEKTEKEGEQEEQTKEGALSFSFAKIWEADKDSLVEVEDQDQGDSWAQTLEKITAERAKMKHQEVAVSGRGVRRRAAIAKPNAYMDGTPIKPKTSSAPSSRSGASNGSAFSDIESDNGSDTTSEEVEDGSFALPHNKTKAKSTPPRSPERNGGRSGNFSVPNEAHRDPHLCGLCATRHGPGHCFMTDSSKHLAEFREMLLLHADDEPWEQRKAAIDVIDVALMKRGHTHLVEGQPLFLVAKKPNQPVDATASKNLAKRANGVLRSDHPVAREAVQNSKSVSVLPQPRSSDVRPVEMTQPIAGPSKRPASPLSDREPKKMKPIPSTRPCLVCGQPPHPIKLCPVVVEGPQSILKQIKRLDRNTDIGSIGMVNELQKILSRQVQKSN